MKQQIETLKGKIVDVDFEEIVKFFPEGTPGGSPGNTLDRLNQCAQLSGFGHAFSDPAPAALRQTLGEMLNDEIFRLAFCEIYAADLPAMHAYYARQQQPQAPLVPARAGTHARSALGALASLFPRLRVGH